MSYSPDSTANSETTIPECSKISSKSFLLKTDQTGSRNWKGGGGRGEGMAWYLMISDLELHMLIFYWRHYLHTSFLLQFFNIISRDYDRSQICVLTFILSCDTWTANLELAGPAELIAGGVPSFHKCLPICIGRKENRNRNINRVSWCPKNYWTSGPSEGLKIWVCQ